MLILDAYLLRVYALCYAHDDLQSTGILKNECFVKVLIVRRLSLQYNTIQYNTAHIFHHSLLRFFFTF